MDQLRSYATKAIMDIIPLDKDTVTQIVDYTISIELDGEVINHLKGMLGDSDDATEFIRLFLNRRKQLKEQEKSKAKKETPSPVPSGATKLSQKQKAQVTKDQNSKSKGKPSAWNEQAAAKKESSNSQGRLSKVGTSTTTSGLLDLSKKPATASQSKQSQKRTKKKNIDNLKDIEAVLHDLELDANHDGVIRVCNCMGLKHPLFEVTPNCLNCGKIICSKEGLQPCSFCGADLLSTQEINDIVNILESERSGLEDKTPQSASRSASPAIASPNESGRLTPVQSTSRKHQKITVSMRPGENLWQAQDRMLKEADSAKKKAAKEKEEAEKDAAELQEQLKKIEDFESKQNVDPALIKAQERLNTLLHFQETGAERTKIIDNASDFEMPTLSSGSIWLSPTERALQLKKQQRLVRKYEGEVAKRSGRGKRVVEMVIQNGKVVMQEKIVDDHKEAGESEEEDVEKLVRERRQAETELTTWDYEKDAKSWKTPVYAFASDEVVEEDKENYVPKLRVQVLVDAEANELLA